MAPADSDPNLFSCWDCSELVLVPFDEPALDIYTEESEGGCQIHDVSFPESDDAGDKASSAQRLKLHIEVIQGVERLKFQYYFETFGELAIPK